jgi:hypothetical protein
VFPCVLFLFGLSVAWLVIWPLSFVTSLGFYLIQQVRLKRSIINWFIAMALITIPWAYFYFIRLTVELKILTIGLLATTTVIICQFYLKDKFRKIIHNMRKKRDSKSSTY